MNKLLVPHDCSLRRQLYLVSLLKFFFLIDIFFLKLVKFCKSKKKIMKLNFALAILNFILPLHFAAMDKRTPLFKIIPFTMAHTYAFYTYGGKRGRGEEGEEGAISIMWLNVI